MDVILVIAAAVAALAMGLRGLSHQILLKPPPPSPDFCVK